jgi:3-hydroxyacyl-[acyl-carrier-protein] dehydratase
MVDRVTECDGRENIKSIKNVSGGELALVGHFPDVAIMPGVLIIEGMAQTAALLLRLAQSAEDLAQATATDADRRQLFLLASADVKFFKPVVPGDTIQYEVRLAKQISTGAVADATASVGGEKVAKGTLCFGVKDLAEL